MPSSLQREIFKKQPFRSPHQEAYLNLVRSASLLESRVERLLKPHGLSPATYNVLRILRGAGEDGRKCHEIGEHMITRVPDITRLVDRLERAALARRERCDKDRRAVFVRITPAGLKLLARIDEPLLELHAQQLGHMTRKQLDALSELLALARRPELAP